MVIEKFGFLEVEVGSEVVYCECIEKLVDIFLVVCDGVVVFGFIVGLVVGVCYIEDEMFVEILINLLCGGY